MFSIILKTFSSTQKLFIDLLFRVSHINKGFVFIFISCIFYAFLNSTIKYLGNSIDPLFLVFCKSFFAMLILFPIVITQYKPDLKFLMGKTVLWPNMVRVGLSFVGSCFWFIGLKYMNLTECVAISFTTPLFIMLFSIIFLKEQADIVQWMLLLIGFLAAIYIKAPDIGMMNYYSLLVLIAAALWASSAIIFKKFVISNVHPVSVVFFSSVVTCFLSTPMAISYFPKLDWTQLMYLISMSVFTIAAQIFAAFAYKFSQLNVIIPLDFNRLTFTSILAYILFDELLSQRTLIGASVIVISSSYLISLHNSSKRRLAKV